MVRFERNDSCNDAPPPGQWDDWVEYDAAAWPRKVEKHYAVIPTVCSHCESACGLLAYVDKADWTIRRTEGNPHHPLTRGHVCPKGAATVSQIYDRSRILFPLKRQGERGQGRWERISWDRALTEISEVVRKLFLEDRRNEIIYHVRQSGNATLLRAWGIEPEITTFPQHLSGPSLGYDLWQGSTRYAPDYANARFVLLISSPRHSGESIARHLGPIVEAGLRGAKLAVLDPHLSSSTALADLWLAPYPGTEPAVLLSIASAMLEEGWINRDFMRRWTNWQEFMSEELGSPAASFDEFLSCLRRAYRNYSPNFAEQESGIPASEIMDLAQRIARAGTAFVSQIWPDEFGTLGRWQVARSLYFLNVLTGSVAISGSSNSPGRRGQQGELLGTYENPNVKMNFLMPHSLKEGTGKAAVYFSGESNPVWSYPDGGSWLEVLQDPAKVSLHAALTSVWNETAWLADYVLPMGLGPEQHHLYGEEFGARTCIAFQQPVIRVAREESGKTFKFTYQANPGEIWEEDEFWSCLSWNFDPDGLLGIRKHFESRYRSGERKTAEEHYRWIFENEIPGLPEQATAQGLSALEYMRKYGVFELENEACSPYEKPLAAEAIEGSVVDSFGRILPAGGGAPIGVMVEGKGCTGFPTPSRRLEFFSGTLKECGWPEYALPIYERSHVHWTAMNREEYILIPASPTSIDQGSGNCKWLSEIAHVNPLWMATRDAEKSGFATGDLIKVVTEIGYFVTRVWVTEGVRPGVVACSHGMGHWRLSDPEANGGLALVSFEDLGTGRRRLRRVPGVSAATMVDPGSRSIWWDDVGVPQSLALAVHPDSLTGLHCWHTKVSLEHPGSEDRYGDVVGDTSRSFEIYNEWLVKTRGTVVKVPGVQA